MSLNFHGPTNPGRREISLQGTGQNRTIPDANGGAREAEEKLKEINAAYSTLRASEHLPVE